MRTEWVAKRKNDNIRTQMHYARQGVITEEMRLHRRAREDFRRTGSRPKWRAAA